LSEKTLLDSEVSVYEAEEGQPDAVHLREPGDDAVVGEESVVRNIELQGFDVLSLDLD
jgi:hypothetical protein